MHTKAATAHSMLCSAPHSSYLCCSICAWFTKHASLACLFLLFQTVGLPKNGSICQRYVCINKNLALLKLLSALPRINFSRSSKCILGIKQYFFCLVSTISVAINVSLCSHKMLVDRFDPTLSHLDLTAQCNIRTSKP